MQHTKIKLFILLFGIWLPTAWCGTFCTYLEDGDSHIEIKQSLVQSIPRGTVIQASIDGHFLTVTFTRDIGTLAMGLDKVSLDVHGDKVLRIGFPSAIRDLKNNTVTNTFGDAVFALTKFDDSPIYKKTRKGNQQ